MHPEYKAEEEKDAMGSRDQNARGKGRKSQIIGGSNRNISKAKTPYVGLCNQGTYYIYIYIYIYNRSHMLYE